MSSSITVLGTVMLEQRVEASRVRSHVVTDRRSGEELCRRNVGA